MPMQTIVDAYVRAIARRALPERLEEGGFVATVPDAFGIVASGDDLVECGTDLYQRLEQWVFRRLSQGERLPVVGGIDLNAEKERAIVAYRPAPPPSEPRLFFENEEALDEFFAKLDRE